MINDYGFRINKYLKVSIVICVIDFVIFYILGKIINDISVFNLITSGWKYISLFIITVCLVIYYFDIVLFNDRLRKYKLLFLKKEPFAEWTKYINKGIIINGVDKNKKFYKEIYYVVKDNPKIKAIMEDEIVIRDTSIHLITSNVVIMVIFFLLERVDFNMYIYCLLAFALIYICMIVFYKKYLKYYISEIYREYINSSK